MAVFSAAVAAVGSFLAGAAVSSVVATVATRIALGVAVNALATALFGKKAKRPKVPGINRTLRSGQVPRGFVLGRQIVGGSLVYANSLGIPEDDDDTAIFVKVVALSDLPVSGIHSLKIDGKMCSVNGPLSGSMGNFGYRAVPEYTLDGDDHAWYRFYDGNQTACDSFLRDRVSSPDLPWSSDAVGHGVSYIVMAFRRHRELFPGGYPEFSVVVDGVPIIGPDNERHDRNPVAQAWYLAKGVRYGEDWLFGPQRDTYLSDDNIQTQIDVCDLPVPGAESWTDQEKIDAFGSTTVPPQYESGYEVNVSSTGVDVLMDIMAACNGVVSEDAGRFVVRAGPPPDTPTFGITDDDVITTSPRRLVPFAPLASTVNGITATFPNSDKLWEDFSPPPLYNPDYEEKDGNRRLVTEIRFDAVSKNEQVQRLMATALRDFRLDGFRKHSIVLPPEFMNIAVEDVIEWASDRHQYFPRRFKVDAVAIARNGDVYIDITGTSLDNYLFRAEEFTKPDFVPSVTRPRPTFPVPDWSVAPAPNVLGIDASWKVLPGGETMLYEVYLGNTNTLVTSGVAAFQNGEVRITAGLKSITDYEVRGKRVGGPGLAPWSLRLPVTTGDFRLEIEELSVALQDYIDSASDLASDALLEANEANATATTVVNDLATLTEGFVDVTLKAAFDSVYSEITYYSAASASSSIVRTSSAENGVGGWTNATVADDSPPGYPTAKAFVFSNGARELPARSSPIKNRRFSFSGWFKGHTSARFCLRQGSDDSVNTIIVQSSAALGGSSWRFVSGEVVTGTHAGEWAPGFYVEGANTIRCVDLSVTDITESFALVQSESVTRADETGSLAASIDTLQTRAGSLEGEVTGILALESSVIDGTSFGVKIDELTVSADDTSASVQSLSNAFADLEGNASASLVFRVVAGQSQGTLEIVAYDDATNGAATAVKANADYFIAPGTMSTSALVVGLGENLIPHSDFGEGLSSIRTTRLGVAGTECQFLVRPGGAVYTNGLEPVLEIFQNGSSSDGFGQVGFEGIRDESGTEARIAVKPDTNYMFSAHMASLRCHFLAGIWWYDESGNQIGAPSTESFVQRGERADAPDTWRRYVIKAKAPANAKTCRPQIRKTQTFSGDTNSRLFIHKPMLEEVHQEASKPSAYVDGKATYISGGRVITDSFYSRSVNTSDFSAAGLSIFGGDVQSNNWNPGVSGWQIDQSGDAEFNSVVIRRNLVEVSGFYRMTSATGGAGGGAGFHLIETFWSETSIPYSAWNEPDAVYQAVAGTAGWEVDADTAASDSNNVYWGVVAEVFPFTRWSTGHRLWVRLQVWGRNVNSISIASGVSTSDFGIPYTIRKVT